MKKFKGLNKKGFTLIELLVVMILIGVVSTAVYKLFSTVGGYTDSVSLMNEYQNLTTDALYRLRVELADRAFVETFDSADTETDGTAKYNAAALDINYGYIVADDVVVNADGSVTGGGAVIKGIKLDAANNVVRTPDEVIGDIGEEKPYRIQIGFSSGEKGRTTLSASIVRTDYTNPDTGALEAHTVYSQSTVMMLRSGKASTMDDPADAKKILRYRIAS